MACRLELRLEARLEVRLGAFHPRQAGNKAPQPRTKSSATAFEA